MQRFLAVLLLSLLSASAAYATTNYEDGFEALQQRDGATALRLLKPYAEDGDALAEYAVGSLLEGGFGNVDRQPNQAILWFERAAQKGLPEALGTLGRRYRDGQTVARDPALAVSLLQKAAEAGLARAAADLGFMYFLGSGITVDDAMAFFWFQRATDGGDPMGEVGLATLYVQGRGVPRDDAAANALYLKAAQQGQVMGQLGVGEAYRLGAGYPVDPVKAFVWLQRGVQNRGFTDLPLEMAAQYTGHRDELVQHLSASQRRQAERMLRENTD